MKKIISGLLLLGLMIGAPLSVSAQSQQYEVELNLTVPAENAPELEDLVEEEAAKDRDKEDYTEDSWKDYEEALKEAEDALTNAPHDEERVNAALDKLEKAIQGLTPVQTTQQSSSKQPTTGRKPSTSKKTTKKKLPKTGMIAGTGLSSLGLLVVGGVIVRWKKRK